MRLLAILLAYAILCCANGTSSCQTFEPASFYYGQGGGNEIEKLDRDYCMQHIGKALFRKPSSFALVGEIFPGNFYLDRFMLATDEAWGRVVFGKMDQDMRTYGSKGWGAGEYHRAASIEVDPGLWIYVTDHINSRVDILKWNGGGFPKRIGSAGCNYSHLRRRYSCVSN